MKRHRWCGLVAAAVCVVAACSSGEGGRPPPGGGGGSVESSSGSIASTDVCDAAREHAEQCFPDATSAGSASSLPCTGVYVCAAGCVNTASCDALTGRDREGNEIFLACIDDCGIARELLE